MKYIKTVFGEFSNKYRYLNRSRLISGSEDIHKYLNRSRLISGSDEIPEILKTKVLNLTKNFSA